jgi:hypothetical protein
MSVISVTTLGELWTTFVVVCTCGEIVLRFANAAEMESIAMARSSKTEPIRCAVQFDGDLLDEINAFREAQPVPPTQSETLRFVVRTGLRALRGERQTAKR